MRLPLTILLGALIVGGIVGVVAINMRPTYDDGRLQPITVDAPQAPPAAPPPAAPTSPPAAPISPPVDTNGVPAPPPALVEVEPTDDGGHHRGGDDRGGDDGGHGGGDDHGGDSGNSGPG